jgi:hypothetical protein
VIEGANDAAGYHPDSWGYCLGYPGDNHFVSILRKKMNLRERRSIAGDWGKFPLAIGRGARCKPKRQSGD